MRQPGNRFVSCVRCEAVCTRETMLFPSLGLAAVNSAPGRGRARVPACPSSGSGVSLALFVSIWLCSLILLLLVALVWGFLLNSSGFCS